MPANQIGQPESSSPYQGAGEHKSGVRVLLAPWIWFLFPRYAARTLIDADRRCFAFTFVICLLMPALTLVGLEWWDETDDYHWQQPATWPPPTTSSAPAATAPWQYPIERRHRSFTQVWHDWHSGELPWWGPAETIFALTVLFGTLAVAGMAWLQMVRVHRTGSVWAAYRRSFRAVAAGLGALTIGIFLLRSVSILVEQSRWFDFLVKIDLYVAAILVVPSMLWLGLAWFSAAIHAAEAEPAELDLPPRCEGCGYDLTHQPTDGRCTECGLEVALSLTPDGRRPGSPWRRAPSLKAWIETTWLVLFSPQRFYSTLQLRTPDSTERGFAVWHYAALVCGVWLWAHISFFAIAFRDTFIYGGPGWYDYEAEMFIGFLAASLSFVVGCWLGHRCIAAGVVSWWMARRSLPDSRWAAKIVAYESAFLWIFCSCWGLMLVGITLFVELLSKIIGPRGIFGWGIHIEASAMVSLMTLALGAIWLWRYRLARRAIQWNNF